VIARAWNAEMGMELSSAGKWGRGRRVQFWTEAILHSTGYMNTYYGKFKDVWDNWEVCQAHFSPDNFLKENLHSESK
jgi:hypothetical protein